MKLKDLSEQKFSFTLSQLHRLWGEINEACFDGELTKPRLLIEDNLDHMVPADYLAQARKEDPDAEIMGFVDEDIHGDNGLVVLIADIMSGPKELVEVVAHEMVHQALAEKHGYKKMCQIGHGHEFMEYAEAIKKYHNTTLIGKEY